MPKKKALVKKTKTVSKQKVILPSSICNLYYWTSGCKVFWLYPSNNNRWSELHHSSDSAIQAALLEGYQVIKHNGEVIYPL